MSESKNPPPTKEEVLAHSAVQAFAEAAADWGMPTPDIISAISVATAHLEARRPIALDSVLLFNASTETLTPAEAQAVRALADAVESNPAAWAAFLAEVGLRDG